MEDYGCKKKSMKQQKREKEKSALMRIRAEL